jgi:hypothetical protein
VVEVQDLVRLESQPGGVAAVEGGGGALPGAAAARRPDQGGGIRRALEETLRRRRLERVLEHAGKVALDLDQDRLARLREEG